MSGKSDSSTTTASYTWAISGKPSDASGTNAKITATAANAGVITCDRAAISSEGGWLSRIWTPPG